MQTGSPHGSAQAGFTYLLLLLVVAIGSAGLAALGTQWRTTVQRERETELLFRGSEIAAGIAAYRAAVPGQPQWPRSFDDLLEDRRGGVVRRHLRRAYADPFTGKPDWVLTRTEDGGFSGVRSRSEMHAYITRGFEQEPAASGPDTGAGTHSSAAGGPPPVSLHHFGTSASGVPGPSMGIRP